jgi:hypothetical protein
MAVTVSQKLVRLLARALNTDRMIDVLMDRERHFRHRSVNGAGRRIDQVPDCAVPASLENVHESADVAANVSVRVDERIADLRGEVDDHIEFPGREQLVELIALGNVEAHEAESVELVQLAQPRLLQRNIVVIVHVIEADDALLLLQQSPRQVKTDEPQEPMRTGAICKSASRRLPFAARRPVSL